MKKVIIVAGHLTYGSHESGNLLLTKSLLSIDYIQFKVIIFDDEDSFLIDCIGSNEIIKSKNFKNLDCNELVECFGPHDFLVLVSEDLCSKKIFHISNYFKSKVIYYLMTHNLLGSGASYPELTQDLLSKKAMQKMKDYKKFNPIIICASTHSLNIVNKSFYKNFEKRVIPLDYDEIPIIEEKVVKLDFAKRYFSFFSLRSLIFLFFFIIKFSTKKKTILWGTTQPKTRRKGLEELSIVLSELERIDPKIGDKLQLLIVGPTIKGFGKLNPLFLGYADTRLKLALAYKISDAFCCTTLSDAGPMMIAESIRNSCPVFGFSSSIILDLVDGTTNGAYVENYNCQKLAKIIHNHLFYKPLTISKKKVDEFNNFNSVILKWKKLFQSY